VEQISVRIERRDPPLKLPAARTRHREQVTIPRWLGGIGSQGAVGAVVVDEVLKIGQERQGPLIRTP
jgi:hypothetical protein